MTYFVNKLGLFWLTLIEMEVTVERKILKGEGNNGGTNGKGERIGKGK